MTDGGSVVTFLESGKALIMMDIIVGVIGVVLIVYLFAAVIWPDKF